MNRMATLVLAAGTALTVTAATAEAQTQVRAHLGPYFGVGAGLTIPTGDVADVAKTGWNATAQLGYEMASGLGLRGDFYYGQHSLDDDIPLDGKFKLAGVLGNVTYTFRSEGKLHPYVVGTLGAMNTKFDDQDGETNATFGGGAGMIYHIGHDSNFFAEARYLSINGDDDNTNIIPIQVGVRFGI